MPTTSDPTPIEAILRHERRIVLGGLLLVCALAWGWVLAGAGTGMSTLAMTTWQFPPPVLATMPQTWTIAYALVMVLMWWVMMIAMMTPSAAPMILLYGRAYRHEQRLGKLQGGVVPTLIFALGYLMCWATFSIGATGLQWGLQQAGLLHHMTMWSISPYLTAALLIGAGLYQLSALKDACLEHCRSPAHYLARNFRPGTRAALLMGWKHGLYCLGCCSFLMLLLFAGGIMNLIWIAGLAVYVLIEKVAPKGFLIARGAGIALILAGAWVAARTVIT